MVNPLSLAVAAALAFGASYSAHADDAIADLDESRTDASAQAATPATLGNVIVTGSRLPRAADRIPGAAAVITKQGISNSQRLTQDATPVLPRLLPGSSEPSQALTRPGEPPPR